MERSRIRTTLVSAALLVALVGTDADAAAPPSPTPGTSAALAGFAARDITPHGTPPGEWADYFAVDDLTGIWGEPFDDSDGDGCRDDDEVFSDHPWNHTGDAHFAGTFEVDGVTIVGDPQSAGKFDGLRTNAGFGSECPLGVHDPIWARAAVIDDGTNAVAMVSVDLVGFFNIEVQRVRIELAARHPDVSAVIDEVVVASTHTHEAIDTMGLWSGTEGLDGKSPAYQAFVRSQIIDAIADAVAASRPARVQLARTHHTVGVRDGRVPDVIDPWALSARVVAADGSGDVLGTIVNWSNHPESMADDQPMISSDFVHGTRETLEARDGGVAVYFSGSVGGMMTPLGAPVVDPATGDDHGTAIDWDRTYAIGKILADAVAADLDAAPITELGPVRIQRRELFIGADNAALAGLNAAGVFDVPTYVGGESWGADPALWATGTYASRAGTQFRTEMVHVEAGLATFLTVPGELFPELEVGFQDPPVAACGEANTGYPFEPVIDHHVDDEFHFVLGLGQDELGYIVPRYDHWFFHADGAGPNGDGAVPVGALEQDDPCGEGHYEETVSASSTLAPWTTCVAAEMSGHADIWHTHDACTYANTHTTPHGLAGNVVDQYGVGRHPGHDH